MKNFSPLLVLLLAGCSTTARMYPTEGPLAQRGATAPYEVKVSGVLGNNGSLSSIVDGVPCRGEWSSAAGRAVSSGSNAGKGILLCEDGNVIEVNFSTGSGTATGFGNATDKRGNKFKVLF